MRRQEGFEFKDQVLSGAAGHFFSGQDDTLFYARCQVICELQEIFGDRNNINIIGYLHTNCTKKCRKT